MHTYFIIGFVVAIINLITAIGSIIIETDAYKNARDIITGKYKLTMKAFYTTIAVSYAIATLFAVFVWPLVILIRLIGLIRFMLGLEKIQVEIK